MNTNFKKILCGIPPGLVIGSLLFLIYVNDLKDASKCLDSVMLFDDTNRYYSHKNIKDVFYTLNLELEKISQ